MESFIRKLLHTKILTAGFIAAGIISSYVAFGQVALIPRAAIVQKGGSIGLSIGFGYNLSEKHTLDFMYGYVPPSKGGTLHIIGAKFAYKPFDLKVTDFATIYPVNPGAFITYHFGKKFDISRDRDQFPKGYYWWPTALRAHISFSNEIKLHSRETIRPTGIKSVGLYSEFNTNDLYFLSWFQNQKSISLPDIFKMGYGLRASY